MHIASRLAAAIEMCPPSLPERIASTLRTLGLPTQLSGYHPEAMLATMRSDKKAQGGRIHYILPREIGQVSLVSEEIIPPAILTEVLHTLVWNK